jgi:uncharacterized LabA/DUF88 family protein
LQSLPFLPVRAWTDRHLYEDQEYWSIHPPIDWLDYNGYTVVTKPGKEFFDTSGRREIRGFARRHTL